MTDGDLFISRSAAGPALATWQVAPGYETRDLQGVMVYGSKGRGFDIGEALDLNDGLFAIDSENVDPTLIDNLDALPQLQRAGDPLPPTVPDVVWQLMGRVNAPAQGDVIVVGASGIVKNLPAGDEGDLLLSHGSGLDPEFAPPGTAFNSVVDVSAGAGALTVYGHSINYIGASTYAGGVAQRLAAMLDTDLVMKAIGGAAVSLPGGFGIGLGAGGWDHVYRFTATANDTAQAKGTPRRGPVSFFTGCNDMSVGGTSPGSVSQTTLAPVRDAYRACVSRFQAINVYEENDASVTTPDGGYTRTAYGSMSAGSVNMASGAFTLDTPTNGKRVVINVPADDAAAGTVVIGFVGSLDGGGAVWDVKLDGSTVTTIDTRNRQAIFGGFGWAVPVIYRFTGLSATTHTITLTPSSISGAARFDCWWTEAHTQAIGLWQQYHIFTGTPDADVDQLNLMIANIAAEFGSNVFAIPTTDVIPDSTYTTDGLHCNDKGHGALTARGFDYFSAHQPTRTSKGPQGSVQPYVSRFPNVNTRNIIHSQLPGVSPFGIQQFGGGYGKQTADLLPLYDGDGNVIPGVGLGPNGKLKAMVGSNVRIARGFTTSTHTGTRSGFGPAFTHNLGIALTADVIAGSLNQLQNVVVTTGEALNSDLIGRHVMNVTSGGGSAMVNGARITAVSGTTLTLDRSFAGASTGGQYAIKPDIFFTQATIAGLFGVCVGGPADPATVAQTAQQSAVGTWADVNGSAPSNPTTFNLYWVALG